MGFQPIEVPDPEASDWTDKLTTGLQLGGAVVGGVYGGLATGGPGALPGAAMGSGLGGAIGGAVKTFAGHKSGQTDVNNGLALAAAGYHDRAQPAHETDPQTASGGGPAPTPAPTPPGGQLPAPHRLTSLDAGRAAPSPGAYPLTAAQTSPFGQSIASLDQPMPAGAAAAPTPQPQPMDYRASILKAHKMALDALKHHRHIQPQIVQD